MELRKGFLYFMQIKFKICLESYVNSKMLENVLVAITQCNRSYRITFEIETLRDDFSETANSISQFITTIII